jgi:hypothetical protein
LKAFEDATQFVKKWQLKTQYNLFKMAANSGVKKKKGLADFLEF